MKDHMCICSSILVSFLFVFATAPMRAAESSEPAKQFDYDQTAALDVRENSIEHLDGISVQEITYASPKGGRVSAYLIVPEGQGPFAGVIFQHWGFGDRREFLAEGLLLAKGGAISLLVDAPWARPQPWKREGEGHFSQPEIDRDLYVQTVVDLRRGVDLLIARPEVDPQRIAFVGHSYGATWGGVLAGVEKRIKAYVLMAGLPDVSDFSPSGASSFDEIAELVKSRFTKEQVQHYVDIISALAPVRYVVWSSPSAIFMQFARKDVFVSDRAADRYFHAAGQPKMRKWYYCGHELNDPTALADRVRWLEQRLNLKTISLPLK